MNPIAPFATAKEVIEIGGLLTLRQKAINFLKHESDQYLTIGGL